MNRSTLPWRALRRAAAPDACRWLGLAAAVALSGVAAGLAPLALKHMVDALAQPPIASVLGPILAYCTMLLAQRAGEQVQGYAYGRGELILTRRFNAFAYEHLLRLPLAIHLDRRSGALVQAITEGVTGLRLILAHLVLTALPVMVQLCVGALILTSELGRSLALVLGAALVAYGAVFALTLTRLDGPMRKVSLRNLDAGAALSDGLVNVEALKAFTAERRYAVRYGQALAASETQWRTFLRRRLEGGGAVVLVFIVTLIASLRLVAGDVVAGRLTVGDVVMLNAYILQIVRPIEMLGFAARDIGQGRSYLAALADLLDQAAEPRHAMGPPPPPRGADLVFDDVTFGYGRRQPTLRGVSFHVPSGSTLALVGPSGAGKSSIVRLLLGFHSADAGAIRIDGRTIQDIGLPALRRQIALVAQDAALISDTLGANIALGAEGASRQAIAGAADDAGLAELLTRLPDGLETHVGERGLKLSGGERQRVAIARAVLKRARLVVFDEATSALDTATERAVWRAMDRIGAGATKLVITHRLAAIQRADQILVLNHGQIAEWGRHDDLLANRGLYWRLWREQHAAPIVGG